MYQPKLERDIRCPLEYGLRILGGKWKSRIICILWQREALRYSQLRKELGNVTDTALSTALKELLEDEMILRKSFDEIPPRVEYCLTQRGLSAVPLLESICAWSGVYFRDEGNPDLAMCQKCDYMARNPKNP